MIGKEDKNKERVSHKSLWDKSLTTKLVYSYEISPIIAIKDSFLRDDNLKEQYKHYDPLAIALKMLELIIDNMGPYTGITKDDLFIEIIPLLNRMDKARDVAYFKKDDYIKILEYIFEKIIYQSRRKGIRLRYTDYSIDPPEEKEIALRLVTYQNYDGENVVLHAEPVAVNFFLQMLGIKLEDQQKAYLYVLKRLVDRGDYDNILESAKNYLRITNQYELRIESIIRNTRRNLAELDWYKEIPEELRRAMNHISECIKKQEVLNHKINIQLYNIDENIDQRNILLNLKEILEKTRNKVLPLQNKVIEAIETFLDEQWIQELSLKRTDRLNIEEDILNSIMNLRYCDFKDDIDFFIPFFSKIENPKILSYDQLIELILKGLNQKPSIKHVQTLETSVPAKIMDLNVFSEKVRKKSVEYLQNYLIKNSHNSTLDKIIKSALKEGKSFIECNYLRLLIQGRYAQNEFEKRFFKKEVNLSLTGEDLKNPLFCGIDYKISLKEES